MENIDDLIGLHEKLDAFAKHHQNKGGQEAHILIAKLWQDHKNRRIQIVDRDRANFEQGYDAAFNAILDKLRYRFVS